jgi:hypothetical protein
MLPLLVLVLVLLPPPLLLLTRLLRLQQLLCPSVPCPCS